MHCGMADRASKCHIICQAWLNDLKDYLQEAL